MAAEAPERRKTRQVPSDRLTAHQRRIVSHRRAYCRALSRANRVLSYDDCEDVFAETLANDALGLPASLSPREAHQWFSGRLQQRAIDFIRRRDGRRESEKQRRPRFVSLDMPTTEDPATSVESVLPDPSVDVAAAVEADEDSRQAVIAAGHALRQLKPLEQRLLKLRYELPDASLPELAAMLGLTADQANYRLRVAALKFKKALSAGRMGPECDVARAALRAGRTSTEAWTWSRAEAHVAGCWMCRAWAMQHAALAWLPFPAFTKLEWLIARLEAKWRPLAPLPETAAGAGAAGGVAVAGGAGAKLAAFCSASAVTAVVCAGVAGLVVHDQPRPSREQAKQAPEKETTTVAATPTPTPTATPTPPPPRSTRKSRPRTTASRGARSDTREAVVARPAAAPAGSEFEPTGSGSTAPIPPAPAPVTGGTEFTP